MPSTQPQLRPVSIVILLAALACIVAFHASFAFGCVYRSDCNNHGNCVDGKCQCDSGYYPPDCSSTPPGCTTPADCSNHGDCVNGQCLCNAGWTGPTCDKATCKNLTCVHGGTANSACTKCDGCAGCWSGTDCGTYPASPPSTCKDGIKSLYGQAADYASSVAKNASAQGINPVPGWRFLGFGADQYSGQFGEAPLVELDFSDPSHTWTNANGTTFRVPTYMTLTDVDPSGVAPPTLSCTYYPTVTSLFNGRGSSNVGKNVLTDSPQVAAADYFSRLNTITVCTATYTDFFVTSSPHVSLSRYAELAMQSLPGNVSSSNNPVWNEFFSTFGTSILTNITLGGQAMAVYQHGGCYTSDMGYNVDPSKVEAYSLQAFQNLLAGTVWHSGLDPTFVQATRQLDVQLIGGNPEMHLPRWSKSVALNPVPLEWVFTPITDVFPVDVPPSAPQEAAEAFLRSAITAFESDLSSAEKNVSASWSQDQPVQVVVSATLGDDTSKTDQSAPLTPGKTIKAPDLSPVKCPFGCTIAPTNDDDRRGQSTEGECCEAESGQNSVKVSDAISIHCGRTSDGRLTASTSGDGKVRFHTSCSPTGSLLSDHSFCHSQSQSASSWSWSGRALHHDKDPCFSDDAKYLYFDSVSHSQTASAPSPGCLPPWKLEEEAYFYGCSFLDPLENCVAKGSWTLEVSCCVAATRSSPDSDMICQPL